MREVLFIQGAGRGTYDAWDIKLVENLRRELGRRYEVRYPRMPYEDDPTLATWRPVLEKELTSLHDGAVVIGHSVGGTLLINVLADSALPPDLGAIVLIATPFIGERGWLSDDGSPATDVAARLPADVPIFLYHGESDATVPVSHVDLYAKIITHAHVRRLAGRDHQLNNDLSEVARDICALDWRPT
jgi:predicted alpha/beta hydrolase family esterase